MFELQAYTGYAWGQPLHRHDKRMIKKKTKLTADEEVEFLRDYVYYALENNISRDPDDPRHFYDYRGAWKEQGLETDEVGHLPSKFKLEGHKTEFYKRLFE